MIRVQVTVDVPENEIGRVNVVMSARLPQIWQYVRHRRVPQRVTSEGNAHPSSPSSTSPAAVSTTAATAAEATTAAAVTASDSWADGILGGLESHPPCQFCLMGPCITQSEITRIQGSSAPDKGNHTKWHKDYRKFWKRLKDRGLWQHELYIHLKTSAGLSKVELREQMPQCVLDDTWKHYPNPLGVPYMGHKRA